MVENGSIRPVEEVLKDLKEVKAFSGSYFYVDQDLLYAHIESSNITYSNIYGIHSYSFTPESQDVKVFSYWTFCMMRQPFPFERIHHGFLHEIPVEEFLASIQAGKTIKATQEQLDEEMDRNVRLLNTKESLS